MAKAKEILVQKPPESRPLANPAPAVASVAGLRKHFGKTSVLEDISFDVAEGEVVVLLGASGSGKTTILRIIAGLEMPLNGRVIL
ncbi:MAG TPA: ATP-binding cassette domain-containing protein, partial [Pyrinomonadaceae bacterium]|nr:ATP-binding cassette domain-containing protein [Pyrinomonadaceae bacterium]